MPDLYPHQEKAVKELHNGAVLRGGVGVGKSRTAIAYYMEKEAPRDIYVITTAKKRDSMDWGQEASSYRVGRTRDSTVAGILTVDSWNNIGKYIDVSGAFFVFDEQRTVGSGTWARHFIRIARNNRWILLSATPGDSWMDYISIFVANGFYKNRTDFIRRHVVYNSYTKYPKVERYLDTGVLIKHRNDVLVEMPYKIDVERNYKTICVEHDTTLMDYVIEERWNPYEDRPLRNAAELYYTMRKVVNSDQSRLDSVVRLMKKHPRIIIFYNFNYELYMLRKLNDLVETAEWNGHNHEEIPDTERWLYFVQYTAGSEGWNCTSANAMIFYSLTYSYKQYHQAQGRIDRLNLRHMSLFYYTFASRSLIDRAIFGALKKKQNFNEKASQNRLFPSLLTA